MKNELKLTKDQAQEILWEDTEDFTIIRDEIVENSRWSEHHDLIVQRVSDQKFFRAAYSCGLTESQDESPWEYEKEVTFTEVVPVEQVIIDYKDA